MFQKGTFLLDETRAASAEIRLETKPIWADVSLKPGETHILYGTIINNQRSKSSSPRVTLTFLDIKGQIVSTRQLKKSKWHKSTRKVTPLHYEIRFAVPEATVVTRVGFSTGKHNPDRVVNSFQIVPVKIDLPDYFEKPQKSIKSGLLSLRPEKSSDELLDVSELTSMKTYFDVVDSLEFTVALHMTGKPIALSAKSALMMVTFLDASGAAIESRAPIHKGKFGDYVYLSFNKCGWKYINLYAPMNCVRMSLEFAAWEAPAGSLQINNQIEIFSPLKKSLQDTALAVVSGPKNLLVAGSLAEHSYIQLSTDTIWLDLEIEVSNLDFEISFKIDADERARIQKAGILLVEFFDETGMALKSRRPLKKSARFGEYIYVDVSNTDTYTYLISRPKNCTRIRIGLRSWNSDVELPRIQNQFFIKPVDIPRKNIKAEHKSTSAQIAPKNASAVRVAIICDEFTYNSFKYEFKPILFEPKNWRQTFEKERPEIFFCESAWSGADSERRPWKGKIYASENFAKENRIELLEIIEYCKKHSIPTVFWNKEDPSHFDDRIHDFVETAKHFDHVFTTDADCIERYASEHNIQGVQCLPFATQPRIYNPSNTVARSEKVVFAGSWYGNHESRSAEMSDIFDSILAQGISLEIFDRHFKTDDQLHIFPDKYQPYLKPSVPHRELAAIYRNSSYGLNINTVTESSTMFARRVFELMSSNTLVMSNYSLGLDQMFGDSVEFVGSTRGSGMLASMSNPAQDSIRDSNLHEVLAKHTYEDRFRFVLDACGVNYDRSSYEITLVGLANNHYEVSQLINLFQTYRETTTRLLIVLSDRIASVDTSTYYMLYNKNGVEVVSESVASLAGKPFNTTIRTGHFFLVDPSAPPTKENLAKGVLHRKYADCAIMIGSESKYTYSDKAIIRNVLAPKELFNSIFDSRFMELQGYFYHV